MSLALAAVAGMGRRTVTGMLVVSGQAFVDWSAAYRLFSRCRVDPQVLFDVVKAGVEEQLAPGAPCVVHMDDTLLPKTGKKIPGTGWRHDPLGPKFQNNLLWALRFLQLSITLPFASGPGEASVIPVDFVHAPSPRKPKKDAAPDTWQAYEGERKRAALPRVAAQRLARLRAWLDGRPGGRERLLHAVGDGGFTNATVLKELPERTVFTGRLRKDATLYFLPEPEDQAPKGRTRTYGRRAPTPEVLLRDKTVPFEDVTAFAAGKLHTFRVKTLCPVLTRMNGGRQPLRVVCIAPLGYRPHKASRLLYREPAYLGCTDPEQALEDVVQAFMWRWGIEVNHRDEKTLMGAGEAQVRHPDAVARVPAFLAATYAMLQLAARLAYGTAPIPDSLPRPCWQRKKGRTHASTVEVIRHLRAELWGRVMGIAHFSRFASRAPTDAKGEKCARPRVDAAVFYASR